MTTDTRPMTNAEARLLKLATASMGPLADILPITAAFVSGFRLGVEALHVWPGDTDNLIDELDTTIRLSAREANVAFEILFGADDDDDDEATTDA